MSARVAFRSARALAQLLASQAWPLVADSTGVQTWLGQPGMVPVGVPPANETVVVYPAFRSRRDPEGIDAGGFLVADVFELTVAVTTRIPGRTETKVWDRLEVLCDVVDTVVAGSVKSANVPAEVAGIRGWQWWTLNERVLVVPVENGGGWAGSALIDVRVTGRA